MSFMDDPKVRVLQRVNQEELGGTKKAKQVFSQDITWGQGREKFEKWGIRVTSFVDYPKCSK